MINKKLREGAKKLGFFTGIPLGDRGEQDNEIFLALLNNFMLEKYEYNIATYFDTYDNQGWYWTISYSNGLINEQSEHYIFSKIEALEEGLVKLVNDYIGEL